MSKAVTKNNSWQQRAADYSTHGSRTGRNNLGWEEPEDMTREQERACLVARKKKIELSAVRGKKK